MRQFILPAICGFAPRALCVTPVTDSFARAAQRLPKRTTTPGLDRLTSALHRGANEIPGVPVSRDEARSESERLVEEAMRGEFGPWMVSRAIDLAAQWPEVEGLQFNAGRLLALGSDASTMLGCWRAMVERFPASDEILAAYAAAFAKAHGDDAADELYRAYRPNASRPDGSEHAGESIAALEGILDRALAWRGQHPPIRRPGKLGAITLIGGTLGGGGAERQLVNTALGLNARRRTGQAEIGPVTVYCRKLDRRRSHDFYLPQLEADGIAVGDYLRTEPFGGNPGASRLAPIAAALDKLPHRMREGAAHLAELLRYEAPDVVQIWQDGAIFAAGLAALIANVPRIVLTVRTMPPTERADRRKPEQAALYRGLLRADGVTLTANSHIAARAYENWLELEDGSVAVIPNGVEPLSSEGDELAETLWPSFDRRTQGGFLLGGVMRFDDNKRPLEWLEIAAALAKTLPAARFILVGTGPLRAAVEELARRRGIADRILFTGRTPDVGFWLGKMDALMLTSRHEGLPNVLIEAQLAGIPVVTTPAGGAPEAVAEHRANRVLASAEAISRSDACDHLVELASRDGAKSTADSQALSHWAKEQFSVDRMLDRTLTIFRPE